MYVDADTGGVYYASNVLAAFPGGTSTWYDENSSNTTNTSSFESEVELWLCEGNLLFDFWNAESNTFQVSAVRV